MDSLLDPCLSRLVTDHPAQILRLDGSTFQRREYQPGMIGDPVREIDEVTQDRGFDKHDPILPAFAHLDMAAPGVQLDISELQVDQISDSHTGIEREPDHESVSLGGPIASVECREEPILFVLGQDVRQRSFHLRDRDLLIAHSVYLPKVSFLTKSDTI